MGPRGPGLPLAEILEEQKFESKRGEGKFLAISKQKRNKNAESVVE